MNDTTKSIAVAKRTLGDIDDAIAVWYVSGVNKPLHEHLGMTIDDYAKFLFDPGAWAKAYVASVIVKADGREVKPSSLS